MPKQLNVLTATAAIVHDVKNSLGLVNAEINEVIEQVESTLPQAADQLFRVRQENDRINNVIVHLLTLYRAQNDLLSLNVVDVMVEDLLADVCSRHVAAAARFGISMHVHCASDLLGYFDEILIDSVLANVVTNAIRYTKDRIELHAQAEQGGVLFQIIDNGKGYPEMLMDCLEQPVAVDFKAGSTGIGLILAQYFAELHENQGRKGWLRLRNDEGAIFEMWLP